ncbi:hypothetical protein ARMGADRAFT_780339 [Armillaria gallica]|uniref:Uncharacterized protein n=1 Tax=Armillaria gallica TaxID=47427 RepID=A0A2H3CQD9_ARMGA|nr:hypothetical protein ARMGADRAFT_780339 [Armillaria gallica]
MTYDFPLTTSLFEPPAQISNQQWHGSTVIKKPLASSSATCSILLPRPGICYSFAIHETESWKSYSRSSSSIRGTLIDEIIRLPAEYASADPDTLWFFIVCFTLNIFRLLSLAVHY